MSLTQLNKLITNIRNSYIAGKKGLLFKGNSKFIVAVLDILFENGFIKDYEIIDPNAITKFAGKIKNKLVISIGLLYSYVLGRKSIPFLFEINLVSKPSKRIYIKSDELCQYNNYLAILSTHKGIISAKKAKSLNVGGEILLKCR